MQGDVMIMRNHAAPVEELKILNHYELESARLRGVTICEYEPGEYICMEDCPLEALLIVISGRAKVCFSAENGRILLLGFYNESGFITLRGCYRKRG
jgi:CRP-like cAMP-binding protein